MTTSEEVADRIMENPLLFGGIVAGAVGVVGTYYQWRSQGMAECGSRHTNLNNIQGCRKQNCSSQAQSL